MYEPSPETTLSLPSLSVSLFSFLSHCGAAGIRDGCTTLYFIRLIFSKPWSAANYGLSSSAAFSCVCTPFSTMTAVDFDPEYDFELEPEPEPEPEPSSPAESHLTPLPSLLPEKPAVHPGCCLALSAPLLVHLVPLLAPSPRLTLSIGSGYGLLEALLLAEPYRLNIVGVEVQPSSNRYLPASHHRTVSGSRFLEPLAAESATWLFVYPRRVGLVDEYIAAYGDGDVETVVWIGPTADWEDYKGCFARTWTVEVRGADEIGGRAWELIAVATKLPP
jgi:hypothetical protein